MATGETKTHLIIPAASTKAKQKVPRCQGRLRARDIVLWNETHGVKQPYRCSRQARVMINGLYFCNAHAGHYALAILLERSANAD